MKAKQQGSTSRWTIVIVLSFIICLLSFSEAHAQLKFGAKGGLNMTSLSFDENVFNASNRLGFYVGATAKLNTPVVGFDIAAMYEQRDAKVNGETFTMKNVVVPLNLRLNMGVLYLAVGPQIGFNVGDKEFNWKEKDSYENTFQMKGTNLSGNLGGGVIVGPVEVGVTYNIPFGKTADATWRSVYEDTIKKYDEKGTVEDAMKTKTWTISAAYYF
jgi:hypothetical protein